ncbi:MAG: archaetidylinositol phosphate synthase [Candidatus Bathyarchaeia archaeon]
MLTRLKAKIQSVIAAHANIINRIGVSPNMMSSVGVALALLAGIAYLGGHRTLLWAAVLLLLSGYCDMLDGAIARLHKKVTLFGGFLDSLLDRYADSAIYAGIILGGLCTLPWGLAALIGSLLVSYARARGEAAGIKMEGVGIAERAERIIIIAAASIIETIVVGALEAAIIALAILTNLTVLQRSINAFRALKKTET